MPCCDLTLVKSLEATREGEIDLEEERHDKKSVFIKGKDLGKVKLISLIRMVGKCGGDCVGQSGELRRNGRLKFLRSSSTHLAP